MIHEINFRQFILQY